MSETPITTPVADAGVRFTVRRARSATAWHTVPDYAVAHAFAASTNTLSVDWLRPVLHPDVVLTSEWAGVRHCGRRVVLLWMWTRYQAPKLSRHGYRSQLVVMPDGRAGVLTRLTRTGETVLTSFVVAGGLIEAIHVTPRFDRAKLVETGVCPPEH